MKKKLSFIIEIIIGIIFICLGCFVIDTDYYSTLFCAMGFGLAFASGVQLLKICYYEMPKNKEKLEKTETNAALGSSYRQKEARRFCAQKEEKA